MEHSNGPTVIACLAALLVFGGWGKLRTKNGIDFPVAGHRRTLPFQGNHGSWRHGWRIAGGLR
ncbi:MAG: hypothetical protein Q4P23_06425 [Micrococcaceae bacterium]|nr:hypothetical protein [Micrococcaceae bacterium]